jgi:hypothetical protein
VSRKDPFVVIAVVTKNTNLLTMTPPETRSSKRRVTRSSDAFPSPRKEEQKQVAAVAMRPAKRRKHKQTGGIPVTAVARGKRICVRGPFAGLVSRAVAGKLPRKEKKTKGVFSVTVKKVHLSTTGRVEQIGRAVETDEEDSVEEESDHCQAVGICTECTAYGRFGFPCPDCPSDSENFCTYYVPSDAEAGLYDSD